MRLILRRRRSNDSTGNPVLLWTQRILFAIAIGLLGYTGFVLADTDLYQARESRVLDQLRGLHQASPAVLAPTANGGLIGRLTIPRLDISVMVAEGVDESTLRRAAGHIPGTALPGQPGNAGISGHRDTFFRPLRNIRRNDLIIFTTPLGDFRYRMKTTRIVDPADISVLDAGETDALTLVTCYPFYFVGPAPDRFIVRAERLN